MNQRQSKTIQSLPPSSSAERQAFLNSFHTRLRQDAASTAFKFKRRGDVSDPRHTARGIKEAIEGNAPHQIIHEIESGVHLMALAAGNFISLDAPLEAQYLAAFQRISDYHGGRLLETPEEVVRSLALCRASNIVGDAVEAFRVWKKAA
jgi:hypothetical protein